MNKGTINVTAENIFPIIKKFLYSDHEIFIRELISNAVDASNKLKALAQLGEYGGAAEHLMIEVKVDKEGKKIHIIDQGIGMTEEEVEKYINQVAFSGAEEFVNKYKDKSDQAQAIIGHFGLGFYSAFMVAKEVEIFTKSYQKDAQAVKWTCDGSPQFTIENIEKEQVGTEIILHIADDSEEFLNDSKIEGLLTKYCKFMPFPIKFGTKERTITEGEGDDKKEKKVTENHIINNTQPAWIQKPTDLQDEDYLKFYRELYPMQFEDPLFHIHLNVDYPFNLTGVLYFPKIKNMVSLEKDRIQLYQNQVFVTDNVEGIVPDFLNLLRGVIDSPDIPLNVSRSYLQADAAVKKISGYITRKVADKINGLFKDNREDYEQKWDDIKVIVEYGMLSEDKFFEKSDKFYLYPTVDGKYHTQNELIDTIKEHQRDKNNQLVVLYATDKDAQHSYIERAKAKGYEVVLMDSPLVSHLFQKLEGGDEKIQFKRVDADAIHKLIEKDDETISKLNEEEKNKLKELIESNIAKEKYQVQIEDLDSEEVPLMITLPEFMRRMKEMNQTGGGMMGFGDFPESYNLVVNANHPFSAQLMATQGEAQKELLENALSLALLNQNLLKGEALTSFVKKQFEMLKS